MGVFRSQTPRACFCLTKSDYFSDSRLDLWAYPPFFLPVSGLLFLSDFFKPLNHTIHNEIEFISTSYLVCYSQGCGTPLSLSSRKNYQRKPSRYSFLACSRSSFVGAVFDFPNRSRMTILSQLFLQLLLDFSLTAFIFHQVKTEQLHK